MRKLTWYAPGYVSDVTTPTLKFEFSNNTIYFIEQIDGLGAPTLTAQTQGLPLQNGSVFARAKYEPRVISISGQIRKKGIADINAGKAAMSLALAQNVNMSRETWQADFWSLSATYSGIDTDAEWLDFLYNVNGLGYLVYESTGITVAKRINAYVSMGPVFKSKVGTDPYQGWTVEFTCPYPFWEDNEYTLAIDVNADASESGTFTIAGDAPPRLVLDVQPSGTTVSSNIEVLIKGRNPYTPTVAPVSYVNTIIDYKSSEAIKYGDRLRQSFIRGEIQGYTTRAALNVICGQPNGGDPGIAFSTDALNWTDATTVPSGTWSGLAWSPSLNRYVATSPSSPYILYSSDAITWTAASGAIAAIWNKVIWVPELALFFAVGSSPCIAHSPDGITWTAASSAYALTYNAIAYSQKLGRLVAVSSSSPYIATSVDGDTWLSISLPSGMSILQDIIWVKELGFFVTLGAGGGISYDGLSWTAFQTSGMNDNTIAWSSSLGLLVSYGAVSPYAHVSYDGLNWIPATTAPDISPLAIAWSASNGRFIACGQATPWIVTSQDGFTWSAVTTLPTLGPSFTDVISIPSDDSGSSIDTSKSITRFSAKEANPGEYSYKLLSDQPMNWTLYYRKAWLGV